MSDESKYDMRGVSATKDDVHAAIKEEDKGIYPNAFCKVLPDITGRDQNYASIMHADTAGSKTSLAYLYWKETGDLSVWKKVAQDALVMNIDDMACTGCLDNFIISSTIGRNKHLITGDVIKAIIDGNRSFAEEMKKHGIDLHLAGGETADVGDIVRTIDIGITALARLPRREVIGNEVQVGDYIIGLASFGQCNYETEYNSGIGSNGLTSARHDVLSSFYAEKYPESFDPNTDKSVVYTGSKKLTDQYEGHEVGQLLLSPTRTYLPVLKKVLTYFGFGRRIHSVIHNTGGGQTKVKKFIKNRRIVKNKLFDIPPVFRMIQEESSTPWKEMYQVFNMGHRLEIYVSPRDAHSVMRMCKSFGIDTQVIGYVEISDGESVVIESPHGTFEY